MTRFVFLLLLCFVAEPSFATPIGLKGTGGTSTQTSLTRGVAWLAKGKLREAEMAFKKSLRHNPERIGALLGLAQVALKRGDIQEGTKNLKKALKAAPKNPAVHIAWGRFQFSLNKTERAEAALKKAVALSPESAQTRKELGDFYLNGLKKPDKAVRQYRAALRLSPGHVGARHALRKALALSSQKTAPK